MAIQIIYANETYFPSFHSALDLVAHERVHIEVVEAPTLPKVAAFQKTLIEQNLPVYYAIHGERVVGWADISVSINPRLSHRGFLGMGLLTEFRGQGTGSRLLETALKHAKDCGLEKIELNVYTTNTPAIALYRKFGFEDEGLIKKYRKLDGRYFDVLAMGKML